MAQTPFIAKVIGIPSIPTIREVNIRSGPGGNFILIFKVPVGTENLPIIDVQPDAEGRQQMGKQYTWLRVQFPQGIGWVRDDLIEITGDGRPFGYPVISFGVTAFHLARSVDSMPPQAGSTIATGTLPAVAPPIPPTPVQPPQSGASIGTGSVPIQPPPPIGVRSPQTPPQPNIQPEMQPTSEPDPILQPDDATGTQPTIAPEPAVVVGPPTAICMGRGGANLRSGPGTNNNPVGRMSYRDTAELLDGAPGTDGKDFQWAQVNFQGITGWIREDLVRLQGSFGSIVLDHEDQFPCPIPDGWWVRDYDADGSRIGVMHHGWDHGGDEGMPIFSGPVAGKVVRVETCRQCGPNGLSVMDKGLSLNDNRVLRNAAWNFGYGHYVIVRYLNETLPTSTRRTLTENGFEGQHLFVMYAHLLHMFVQTGQSIDPSTQIATCGDSGNSSGPHLHLEVRAHANADQTSWAAMRPGLMNPDVLFLR